MTALQAGKLRLVLDAGTGGAIAAFTHDGVALFRPVADVRLAAQHGRAAAAYPLIPFANRIAAGRFTWQGVSHALAPNFGDSPHTIHGNAWMHPWSVETSQADRCVLAFEYTPRAGTREWPFRYRAIQDFTLRDGALQLTLTLQNTDAAAWLAGIGVHPYIARDAVTELRFDADTVWRNGGDGLPRVREAVAHEWDFSAGRVLNGMAIDECYAGWGGSATVTWPAQRLRLTMRAEAPLDHLQLYTPPGRDFFGLEPVSNMPDAINRIETVSDQGLKMLAPGDMLRASVRFEIEEI